MEILIKEMIADNAGATAHLAKQLGYEITCEQTEENIKLMLEDENSKAFVAIAENKIVGWISVAKIVTIASTPFCEIRSLIVDEAYRKNNIGKLLIEKAKQWSKEKNCERLRLRCNIKRQETHAFYLHLGFAKMKEQTVFEINI
jgi:GNAT superfamily N-acetyltransferase